MPCIKDILPAYLFAIAVPGKAEVRLVVRENLLIEPAQITIFVGQVVGVSDVVVGWSGGGKSSPGVGEVIGSHGQELDCHRIEAAQRDLVPGELLSRPARASAASIGIGAGDGRGIIDGLGGYVAKVEIAVEHLLRRHVGGYRVLLVIVIQAKCEK